MKLLIDWGNLLVKEEEIGSEVEIEVTDYIRKSESIHESQAQLVNPV